MVKKTTKNSIQRILVLGIIGSLCWYIYLSVQRSIDPIRAYPNIRPREAFFFAKTRQEALPGIEKTLADIRARKLEASARVEFLSRARKMGEERQAATALDVLDNYGLWQVADDIMSTATRETQAAYSKYRTIVLESMP